MNPMNLFFAICVACGVAFSLLTVVVATRLGSTRHASTRTPYTPASVLQRIESDDESRKTVNKLMVDMQNERSAMLKREADLRSREEALCQQQEILTMLKADMQQLHNKIEQTTVRASPAEQANLKRLAEVYGKMDPDSVATLLSKMETERAASLLRLLGERQAGAVLAAAVATGSNGVKNAAAWSDSIRRMTN